MGQLNPKGAHFENKYGGSGAVALNYISKREPDQPTVLIGAPGASTLQFITNPGLGFSPNDFQAIGLMYQAPVVLISSLKSPATVLDLVQQAQANPNQFTYSSHGVNAFLHLNMMLFESLFNVQMRHIPYGKDHILPLLSGEVDFAFVDSASANQFYKLGKVNILAVSSRKRLPLFPLVPTLSEYHHQFVTFANMLLLANRNLKSEYLSTLSNLLNLTLKYTELRKSFNDNGILLAEPNSSKFGQEILNNDYQFWKRLISEKNLI